MIVCCRVGVLVSIFIALWLGPATANTLDRESYRTIVWRDRPIAISLVPGREKILSFSEDVQWTVPRELVGIVTGEALAGQVFLTANAAFENQRFRFYGIDSNRYYVLDITASERGEENPLKIRIDPAANDRSGESGSPSVPVSRASGIVELTRYAVQAMVSPERLITPLPDVREVRLKSTEVKERMVPGADVRIRPLAQWRSDSGLYAIGLHVQNVSRAYVELDPRTIRSDSRWKTLALMTGVLTPANQVGDATVAVVIADAAWAEVSQWLR